MEFTDIPDWEALMSVKSYRKVTDYLREYLDSHRPTKTKDEDAHSMRLDTGTDESMDDYDLGRAYIISLEFYMDHVFENLGGDLDENEIVRRIEHIASLFQGPAWRGSVEDLNKFVNYYMRQNEREII
jgi:hypothetical protein